MDVQATKRPGLTAVEIAEATWIPTPDTEDEARFFNDDDDLRIGRVEHC